MNVISRSSLALMILGGSLAAQTQTLRGKVEDLKQTANQFVLDCTNIPLTSNTLALRNLVGTQQILQVVNKGTAASPVLEVRSATPTTKIFDMGNLKLGQSATWQVASAPGNTALVFLNGKSRTGYLPLGRMGTWLVGLDAVFLTGGLVNGQGQFEFRFTMPNLPALVGTTFVGQAVVVDKSRGIQLSNADCREVRAR